MNLYVAMLTQSGIIQVRPLLGDKNLSPVPGLLGCSCSEFEEYLLRVTLPRARGRAYIECTSLFSTLVMGFDYKP